MKLTVPSFGAFVQKRSINAKNYDKKKNPQPHSTFKTIACCSGSTVPIGRTGQALVQFWLRPTASFSALACIDLN